MYRRSTNVNAACPNTSAAGLTNPSARTSHDGDVSTTTFGGLPGSPGAGDSFVAPTSVSYTSLAKSANRLPRLSETQALTVASFCFTFSALSGSVFVSCATCRPTTSPTPLTPTTVAAITRQTDRTRPSPRRWSANTTGDRTNVKKTARETGIKIARAQYSAKTMRETVTAAERTAIARSVSGWRNG